MVAELIEEKKYSVAEYFEMARHSELRYEFHYGKLIEMAGEAKKANKIALNIVRLVTNPFYEKGYEVYAHDVKVEVNNGNTYRCPDMVVAPINDDSDDYFVLFPEIIVEVASKDSMHTDSATKLKEYKKITTMQYYIIAAQEEMEVQFYSRSGDKWMVEVFDLPNDVIELPLFDTSFSLADMYDRVKINGQLFLKD
jgi:Uma2 family endonuclease